MSKRTLSITEDIHAYMIEHSVREPDVLKRLRTVTQVMPDANMQIGPEQGQFMALLARLIGARRCIEVGVFTGYSSLALALALPDDGRIIACDINDKWTSIARQFWREAGVENKIELKLQPASQTLQELLEANGEDKYDYAFIDADKTGYADYYERLLKLMRPGGLILADNTLWSGRVADADDKDEDTVALRAFNSRLLNDTRVDISLVPIGDGLTLARKR